MKLFALYFVSGPTVGGFIRFCIFKGFMLEWCVQGEADSVQMQLLFFIFVMCQEIWTKSVACFFLLNFSWEGELNLEPSFAFDLETLPLI